MRYSRLAAAAILLGAVALLARTEFIARAAGKATTFKVLIPQADATLKIDGKKIEGEGKTRKVRAPALKKGKKEYTIEVMWEPNNYTKIWRKQIVAPGDGEVVVDLRTKNPKIPDHIEVRYVPTPDDIVAAMCKLGKVTKNDVVYDLGCGDGRMVIIAIKKFGAKRGVGIDLDPQRVKESKENAELQGVSDKVSFRVGDVLKVKDLPDASVVLLYMGDDINARLKPILKAKLKPGSRVVSHRFIMGDDWMPTKTTKVTGKDGIEYTLHLWVIGKQKSKEEQSKE
jgi:uncharacterized protein (TIGR03000 family)